MFMILITGAAGFIGSHFLESCLERGLPCIAVDAMTYAADTEFVKQHQDLFYCVDIGDQSKIEDIIRHHGVTVIVNFAAETHVDNSIANPWPFVRSNIEGVVGLLEAARITGIEKFLHVSTDEVYGSIDEGAFDETLRYNPRNPYSATKAASDHLAMAWYHTHGVPAIVTNCANNYGPRQHREKLIPKSITQLLQDLPVGLYGDGQQVRDWIYVRDHCDALHVILERGQVGESYCIGADQDITNKEIVETVCELLNKPRSLITHTQDRPGHDRRYATNSLKTRMLGWRSRHSLAQGLAKTIEFYKG